MYGHYSRAGSNQERVMMARVRYANLLYVYCIVLDLASTNEFISFLSVKKQKMIVIFLLGHKAM